MTTTPRRRARLASVLLAASALTGCAASVGPAASEGSVASDGSPSPRSDVAVSDAAEVPEPARAVIVADERGEIALIDAESGDRRMLAEAAGPVAELATNGRFAFVAREKGTDLVVDVLDSGRWTMPHGDHSHYFRGDPRALGSLARIEAGAAAVAIRVGSDGTALLFEGETEAAVLDHEALAENGADAATRALVAGPALPFAGEMLVATASGIDVPGVGTTPCADSTDADITRVGAVFTCAGGAVLVTRDIGGALAAESIPLPPDANAVTALSGRADRPDLAGVSEGGAAWLLDVRARTWTPLPSDVPLLQAVAIGDDDSRTAALAADGCVRILGADGAVLARTGALVEASLADPALRDHVQLLVDADHAYLSDPAAGVVHVIDLDDAHVAQTLAADGIRSLALVG